MPASISTSGKGNGRFGKRTGLVLALLAVLSACSAAGRRIERDPYYESFYEKTRLIMTDEEIQIYRHLPDKRAKEEFIEEFWTKRDPVPETEENENKIEFERRIAYANRWFRENRPAGRGWDTQRGRILIQLGEPDNRILNEMINSANVKGYERWVYYYYQMELIFVDTSGFGEYKLQNWPPELLTAIDNAKFTIVPSSRGSAAKPLVFNAAFKNDQVVIAIPLKRVRFSEEGDTIRADYKVTVIAYRDYAKVATQAFSRQLSFPKDDVPSEKEVAFSLPFPLQAKGRYYLEVLLEDTLSGSRARDFVEFKL